MPTSATLIYGQRDALLVDAFLTVEQAHALVEWVAASGKNLTTIYITHGHGDHFFGVGTLLERFPRARAVATPGVVAVMRQQAAPEFVTTFWNARYPGQIPGRLVVASWSPRDRRRARGTCDRSRRPRPCRNRPRAH